MGWGDRNCRERLRGGEAAGQKTASLSTADTSAPSSWRSSSRAGRRGGAVAVVSPSAYHGHLRGVDWELQSQSCSRLYVGRGCRGGFLTSLWV